MLNVNFESKTNPKCFWAGHRLNGLLLNVIDGWGTVFNFILKITSWAGLDESGLKLILHLKAHSLIFAKSLLSWEELLVTSWTTEKRDVSFANSLKFDDKRASKIDLFETWSDYFPRRVLTI